MRQLELRRHARELVAARVDGTKQRAELARAKAEITRLRSQLARLQRPPAAAKNRRR